MGRVANDSAFADGVASSFELGFDEDYHFAVRFEEREQGWEDQGDGDKAHVADDEVEGLGDAGGGEVAGVGVFEEDDAEVGAELPIDLAGAGVDGVDAGGSVLEETVGESARGGADVGADAVLDGDVEVGDGGGELDASTADVWGAGEEFDPGGVRVGVAGLGGFLAVGKDGAGEDEGAGFLAGISESAEGDELVEAMFQGIAY